MIRVTLPRPGSSKSISGGLVRSPGRRILPSAVVSGVIAAQLNVKEEMLDEVVGCAAGSCARYRGFGGTGPGRAGSAPAAVRYSSARQVIAVDHRGLRCGGASYSSPPVVHGATSEASCSFKTSTSQLIDVFPGSVTTATVLRNSVSTGTEKIWSDVGPNWWCPDDQSLRTARPEAPRRADHRRPWHPPGSVTLSYSQGASICRDLNSWARTANNQDTPRFSAQLESDESAAAGSQLGSDLASFDGDLQTENSAALEPGPPGDEQSVQFVESDCSAYGVTFTP